MHSEAARRESHMDVVYEYFPVGSNAASMPHTVLNQIVSFTCAPLVTAIILFIKLRSPW
jgi:hypothetical protein